MIAYTSGTTGRPKGAVHVHGGFLVKMASEAVYQADLHPDETLYWVTDMGWIMGPWEMVGAGCIGATRRDVRGRARLARARSRVGVGRAPPRERARGLADADPGAASTAGRRAPAQSTTSRACACSARPASRGTPSRTSGCPRWSAEGRVPIINISGGTEVGACFLTPYPVEELKVCSLGGASHGMDVDVFDAGREPGARRGGRAGLQAAVARDDARHLGRPRALHRDLLVDVPGRLAPRRLGADRRRRRLVPARPLRRHDQRRGQAARAGRGRVGARVAPGGGGVGGRRRARRDEGRGDLVLLRGRRRRRATTTAEELRELVASELGRPFKPSRVVFVRRRCRRRARPRSCGARCARSRSARTPATCRAPRTLRRSTTSAPRWPERLLGGRARPPLGGHGLVDQPHQALDACRSPARPLRDRRSPGCRRAGGSARCGRGRSRHVSVIAAWPRDAATDASVPMRQTWRSEPARSHRRASRSSLRTSVA